MAKNSCASITIIGELHHFDRFSVCLECAICGASTFATTEAVEGGIALSNCEISSPEPKELPFKYRWDQIDGGKTSILCASCRCVLIPIPALLTFAGTLCSIRSSSDHHAIPVKVTVVHVPLDRWHIRIQARKIEP